MAEEAEDRTEAATPARLVKAKTDGNAPISRELPVLFGLLAATLALASVASVQAARLATAAEVTLENAGNSMSSEMILHNFWAVIITGIYVVLPIVAASAAAIIASNLVQTGFNPHFSLQFNFLRISPGAGLARLFSLQNAASLFKSIFKITFSGFIAVCEIYSQKMKIFYSFYESPEKFCKYVSISLLETVGALIVAQLLVVIFDFFYTKIQFSKSIRMSRSEVKEEAKDSEGNPHIKARFKKLLFRPQQNLKAVARAAVVVTNPTHYAVALEYRKGQTDAPKLIAKGAGEVAARIRSLANVEGIPIVSNPPLARALFKLEIDTEIPQEHYKAVAEIIAYIWRFSSPSYTNRR